MEEPANQDLLQRYLLGALSEDDRRKVELRLLADDDYYALLLAAEDELVDEYIDGTLSPEDAQRFDAVFLVAPERRTRLRFATALRRKLNEAAAPGAPVIAKFPSPSVWRQRARAYAAAAAFAALASAAGYLWIRGERLEGELDRTRGGHAAEAEEARRTIESRDREYERVSKQLAEEREARSRLEDEMARLRVAPAPEAPRPAHVMLDLEPNTFRAGGATRRAAAGAGVTSVLLRLGSVPTGYESFAAAILDPEGAEVWSSGPLRARGKGGGGGPLTLSVPAASLRPNDYQVRLDGVSADGARVEIARYAFRFVRR